MRKCEKCGKIFFESPSLIRECPKCKKSFCNMCWRKKKRKKLFLCPKCNKVLNEISEEDILESIHNSFSAATIIEKNLSLDFSIFLGKLNYDPETGELRLYGNLNDYEKAVANQMYDSEVFIAIVRLDTKLMLRISQANHLTVDSACIPICHFNLR